MYDHTLNFYQSSELGYLNMQLNCRFVVKFPVTGEQGLDSLLWTDTDTLNYTRRSTIIPL